MGMNGKSLDAYARGNGNGYSYGSQSVTNKQTQRRTVMEMNGISLESWTTQGLLELRAAVEAALTKRLQEARELVNSLSSLPAKKRPRAPRSDKGQKRKGAGPTPEMGDNYQHGAVPEDL
jgi:hypothetical protein